MRIDRAHRSGKSLLLQINSFPPFPHSPLRGKKKADDSTGSEGTESTSTSSCLNYGSYLLFKGPVEPKKNKGRASYIIHSLWRIDSAVASCSLRSWECAITNTTSVPCTRSWVFFFFFDRSLRCALIKNNCAVMQQNLTEQKRSHLGFDREWRVHTCPRVPRERMQPLQARPHTSSLCFMLKYATVPQYNEGGRLTSGRWEMH